MACVILTRKGTMRILSGEEGMIMEVERFYKRDDGSEFCIVRDYRYPNTAYKDFVPQMWSLGSDDYVRI